jgi:hypothetical protein
MKKVLFKNKIFRIGFAIMLTILFFLNLFSFLTTLKLLPLVATIAQGIIVYFIISKNKLAKIGIKIWASILIFGAGLSLLGKILKLIAQKSPLSFNNEVFLDFLLLFFGVLVYYLANKTIVIKKEVI